MDVMGTLPMITSVVVILITTAITYAIVASPSTKRTLTSNVLMRPAQPDEGALMTLEEFQNDIRQGYLIDYDGVGVLATHTHVCTGARHDVYPSSFNLEEARAAGFTHVMWYNR